MSAVAPLSPDPLVRCASCGILFKRSWLLRHGTLLLCVACEQDWNTIVEGPSTQPGRSHGDAMTIVIEAFRDSDQKAVSSRTFTNLEQAATFYRKLLELAQFAARERKPRLILTRIMR